MKKIDYHIVADTIKELTDEFERSLDFDPDQLNQDSVFDYVQQVESCLNICGWESADFWTETSRLLEKDWDLDSSLLNVN
jgi:hypothetical protein